MTNHKTFSVVKKVLFAFAAVCLLASCQEDELLPVAEDVETAAASTTTEPNVSSLTFSGSYTQLAEKVECSTCTFVVAENSEVVDGARLGLKPGSVICLNAALKYGDLTFINLEGTEEAPITIGNCK
jgi:hypothetical protein